MTNDMMFVVSDLHGSVKRYQSLFDAIKKEKPGAVLLAGDLLPGGLISKALKGREYEDFLTGFLRGKLHDLKISMGNDYPLIGAILGNDDPRCEEPSALKLEEDELWKYLHNKHIQWNDWCIAGYSYVPPTPFRLKDWERYDVSRYIDPGSIPPTEGMRTVEISPDEAEYSTIREDLEHLSVGCLPGKSIFLFHSPPYQSALDRAALDGMMVDHVPLDVHVGSIAIQRFIESFGPHITLHGHIHESTRITGKWHEHNGQTHSFGAATDSGLLCLLKIPANNPGQAERLFL